MKEKDEDTRERILRAAREVFQERGMDGARMQEIADRAGINKAMLHYYFANKEELFYRVFLGAMIEFAGLISKEMNADKPLEVKLWIFAEKYIEKILQNPHLPLFIMTEVHRNPTVIATFLQQNMQIDFSIMQRQLDEGHAKGEYRQMSAMQLFITMLGICAFPFIIKPVAQIIFQANDETYRQEIEARKRMMPEMIMSYLRIS